jgi:hypothetical protein
VDGADIKVICGFGKSEYFLQRDWTTQITLIPLEKLGFTRKSWIASSLALLAMTAD